MIEVLPPSKSKEVVLRIAKELELPGCGDSGFLDAKPHMRKLMDEIYRQGFAVIAMTDSPIVQKVILKLNADQSANLNA